MPWPPRGYHFHCESCGFYVCVPELGRHPVPAPGVTAHANHGGYRCNHCGGDVKTGMPFEALRNTNWKEVGG